jgi:hypothetical protein
MHSALAPFSNACGRWQVAACVHRGGRLRAPGVFGTICAKMGDRMGWDGAQAFNPSHAPREPQD